MFCCSCWLRKNLAMFWELRPGLRGRIRGSKMQKAITALKTTKPRRLAPSIQALEAARLPAMESWMASQKREMKMGRAKGSIADLEVREAAKPRPQAIAHPKLWLCLR